MNSYGLEDHTQFDAEKKKQDWQYIREAENKGLCVPMSEWVIIEWDYCTELNSRLESHFISECPTFKINYPADEGSAVLNAINFYMLEKHIHKELLQYPDEKGCLIPYLIPITENLSLEVKTYSDLCEPFSLDIGVQIDRFVITENATTADVDQLITFLHEYHIK